MNSADFFLTTAGEFEPLAAPRACWKRTRLSDNIRDDHMLIEIEPALEGQRFGLGAKNVTHLIISSRHQGQTLFPISEWPCFVYVARVLDDVVFSGTRFMPDQVELIAWGTLFRRLEDANTYALQFQR
jgi:hypothetical protein